MPSSPSNADAGIRLVLEEIRDLKRESAEDRKRADEDRRRADEDRRRADEDRRRFESRLIRIEEKQDRTLDRLDKSLNAIAKALTNLTLVTERILEETRSNGKLLKEHTGFLHEIRNSVRRNGNGGNGKHRR